MATSEAKKLTVFKLIEKAQGIVESDEVVHLSKTPPILSQTTTGPPSLSSLSALNGISISPNDFKKLPRKLSEMSIAEDTDDIPSFHPSESRKISMSYGGSVGHHNSESPTIPSSSRSRKASIADGMDNSKFSRRHTMTSDTSSVSPSNGRTGRRVSIDAGPEPPRGRKKSAIIHHDVAIDSSLQEIQGKSRQVIRCCHELSFFQIKL